MARGDLQDGRRVRHGDHFPPHRYIRNTSTWGTTPTEHLLNDGKNLRLPQRVLVLWPGVRPVPLRWESRVQDIGPPETSKLHIISHGENLPEISISTPRHSSTQQPASYSSGHPKQNSQQDRNTSPPTGEKAA